MMKNLFDGIDSAVVRNLSERPEALADDLFLRETANAQVIQIAGVDTAPRTPVELPLTQANIYALNLGLLAEYFETELYSRGLAVESLIPNELRQVFVRFLLNEVMQREILLTVLGSRAIDKPNFDFTAQSRLITVFSLFETFSGLAQSSEDLGVRAYKGQAGNVMNNDFALTTALRFHSVEARHASELRRIRGNKGWITLNQRGNLPELSQPVYNGEEVTVQGGIDLVALTGYSAETVSESFDEPLSGDQVLDIVRNFVRHGILHFPSLDNSKRFRTARSETTQTL